MRPTRGNMGGATRPPAWPCSGWGLPSRCITAPLVSSYLTFPPLPYKRAVSVSMALSVARATWPLASILPTESGLSSGQPCAAARACPLPSALFIIPISSNPNNYISSSSIIQEKRFLECFNSIFLRIFFVIVGFSISNGLYHPP